MPQLLKGHSDRPKKRRFLWQLRVASLILLGLIAIGALVALNYAFNVGAILIAVGVLGQLFLTQLRDQAEKEFRAARAEREDFEKDREFQLREKEILLRAIEVKFQIESSKLKPEQKEELRNLLPGDEE
jgi:hypothetical protein